MFSGRRRIKATRDQVISEDAGFALPTEDPTNVLAALTYFASPDEIVPDNVPVLGLLDDAIMIELCVRELQHETEPYRNFRSWRDNEASRRWENGVRENGVRDNF